MFPTLKIQNSTQNDLREDQCDDQPSGLVSPPQADLGGDWHAWYLNEIATSRRRERCTKTGDPEWVEEQATSANKDAHSLSSSSRPSPRYRSSKWLSVECTWPECLRTFSNEQERDRHYKTVHANHGQRHYKCEFANCVANVKSWTTAKKLRQHNKDWHGPYHCKYPHCPRDFPNGFATQEALNAHWKNMHGEDKGDDKANGRSSGSGGGDGSGANGKDGGGDGGENYSNVIRDGSDTSSMSGGAASDTIEANSDTHGTNSFTALVAPTTGLASMRLTSRALSSETSRGLSSDSRTIRHKLDPRFRVHESKEFEVGRVFKVLWSEPSGQHGTDVSESEAVRPSKYGEKVFHKVRRFVIIRKRQGYNLCIPILTYGGQGTLKRGVHPEYHAVIYSSQTPQTDPKEQLGNAAIKVKLTVASEKLDKMARLNYAKIYTVEHNVKAFFIGYIHKKSLPEFISSYNRTHPSIPYPGRMYSDGIEPGEGLYYTDEDSQSFAPSQVHLPSFDPHQYRYLQQYNTQQPTSKPAHEHERSTHIHNEPPPSSQGKPAPHVPTLNQHPSQNNLPQQTSRQSRTTTEDAENNNEAHQERSQEEAYDDEIYSA